MTNFDKWKAYTDGLSSPDNYLNWTWYYIIAASLQRRVWCGPEHQPLFANIYVILVGPPGVGKGLSIREATEFLKFWRLDQAIDISKNNGFSQEEKSQIEMLAESDLRQAQTVENQGKSGDLSKAGLIPVCADAITYEALVSAVSESFRRINYHKWDEEKQKNILKVYGHSSLCFSLQELASLMRKRTHDTVNYLLGLYDCPLDYEYATLTRGKDRVRRGCLNLLAGTTPSFMQSTFDEKLAEEGFSSRTFYVYSQKNRKNVRSIPPLTPQQQLYKMELLEHVRKLTALYGNIQETPDVTKFMDEWWDEQEKNKHKRPNKSLKMQPYYSRKNIHVTKIAMAMHFSESTEMTISLETYKRAIAFLEKEELNMHLALILEGNNPVSKVSRKILELLQSGKKNFVEILIECHGMLDQRGIEEALQFLQVTGQIKTKQERDDMMDREIVYYEAL